MNKSTKAYWLASFFLLFFVVVLGTMFYSSCISQIYCIKRIKNRIKSLLFAESIQNSKISKKYVDMLEHHKIKSSKSI